MSINVEIIRKIRNIKLEHIGLERIRKRRSFEDLVKAIIEEKPGNLTKEDIKWIMDFIDMDFYKGHHILPTKDPKARRFGELFAEPNKKKILEENSLEDLNEFFIEIYWKENIDKADKFITKLKGVKEGFVSLLLYLKNREKYNILLPVTEKAVKRIFGEELTGSFKERYLKFNELVNKLKQTCDLKPQEVDIILTVIGKENT